MTRRQKRIKWSKSDRNKARRIIRRWDKTDLEEVLSGIPNNSLEEAERDNLIKVAPTQWGMFVWAEMEREDEARDARIRRKIGRI